jgi:glycosyltransferase involved in cell wall biosynthesis
MHVLWISDSPDTPSGFGNVTRHVCAGLAARGHRVTIIGWQTRERANWRGCVVLPTGQDPMASDAAFPYLVRARPDAVIALADVWWLPYFTAPHIRRQLELTDTPWLLYFPIDGETADGGLPASWVQLLGEVDVPIAMSRYGVEVVGRCGVACEYIPHGVDLDVFHPPDDRESAKARVDAAGRFLVLSDSRNQPRKLLPRLLDVFARFALSRPDALLHLHTDPDDEFAQSGSYSYDVRADVRHLGLDTQVRFTPGFRMRRGEGLPLRTLAAYYRAADVHLLASCGEGFGLPTLQAAASGAVPIAGAYSASRELVEGHGEAIAVADWAQTRFGIGRALIDVDAAAIALTRLYGDRQLLRQRSAQAVEFASAYSWHRVLDMWEDLLRRVTGSRGRAAPPRSRNTPRGRVISRELSTVEGTSIVVKLVERPFGRLETAIAVDADRGGPDIRIPTVPPAAEVDGVRVPRRAGQVCLPPEDSGTFKALQRLFPCLAAYIVTSYPALGLLPPGLGPEPDQHHRLAECVLVLNPSGALPAELVEDAARLGVPCVGASSVALQHELWPELTADTPEAAVTLARAVLTDSAFARRAATRADAIVASAAAVSNRFPPAPRLVRQPAAAVAEMR